MPERVEAAGERAGLELVHLLDADPQGPRRDGAEHEHRHRKQHSVATSEPTKAPAETLSSASTPTSSSGRATKGSTAVSARADHHCGAEVGHVRPAVADLPAEPVADRKRHEHDADRVGPDDL